MRPNPSGVLAAVAVTALAALAVACAAPPQEPMPPVDPLPTPSEPAADPATARWLADGTSQFGFDPLRALGRTRADDRHLPAVGPAAHGHGPGRG